MDKVSGVIKKFKTIKIYGNSDISMHDCDVVISALKKEIPATTTVVEESDEDQHGFPQIRSIHVCPVCNKGYRFTVPAYCESCGQKLVKSKSRV